MAFVTPAIPASQIVNVIPSVLPAGGNELQLIAIMLTLNTRVPTGQVLTFPTSAAVAAYFGATSDEAALAAIYFGGFTSATMTPGALLFWNYNRVAVGAWLRGGSLAGLTLAQLQAITGTLDITIDGTPQTGTINLSAATSFSNAASLIGEAMGIQGAEVASVRGTVSGTVMDVTTVLSGTLSVGDVLSDGGTNISAGTYITSLGTGTGGTGTYNISASASASLETITAYAPAVIFDSVLNDFAVFSATTGPTSTMTLATGTAAARLGLNFQSGAFLSQGANASTPAGDMTAIAVQTQNWASFMLVFDGTVSENIAFAQWNDGQVNRYLFSMWTPLVSNTEIGGPSADVAAITAGNFSGTSMAWDDPTIDTIGGEIAAFICGYVASLDFTATNGRATAAFRSQPGLTAQVSSATAAQFLLGYGLNFYGDYTTANQAFIWLYNGSVTGPFKWLDSYVNQIWFNSELQVALMEMLAVFKSIPFNPAGATIIRSACLGPIQQALLFGAIRTGVTLSALQIAEVNAAAGRTIDTTLSTYGWYLQVDVPGPTVRQARGPWPITLWYTDGQSVQSINLSSVLVQ